MNRLTTMLGAVVACGVLLAGCGAAGSGEEPEQSTTMESVTPSATTAPESVAPETSAVPPEVESSPPVSETTKAEPTASEPTSAEPVPVTQEETCDWDNGKLLSTTVGDTPSGPGDADLPSVLIGAWQHTHIDSGSGFEPVNSTTDIRYVFPSTSRLLYCQDVEGATSQAENAAAVELAGTDIVLPDGTAAYTVTAWNADTMVWTNNRDGSLYLLQRR